jgi:RNA recognition motif-containing protein
MDKNVTTERINQILTRMYNADQGKLADYRMLFKKSVPLSRRSAFAAFLVMEMCEGPAGAAPRTSYRSERRQPGLQREYHERPREEVPILNEEDVARLFFNVGKRNHVYIREILSLLLSKTGIKREDIGHIRLLPNYSFVEVRKEQAENVIAALNGTDYRGRNLTVSYARSRSSGTAEAFSAGDEAEEENAEEVAVSEEEAGTDESPESGEENSTEE